MSSSFHRFTARLREFIACSMHHPRSATEGDAGCFDDLALELFRLQYHANPPYREFCDARRQRPEAIEHWSQIPAAPTSAFKELELSCLPPEERTAVFHSSGTTGQRASRHFHSPESLAIYEASLLPWFEAHLLPGLTRAQMLFLTPAAASAPHSSLVHMFETVRREFGTADAAYAGKVAPDGGWLVDLERAVPALQRATRADQPVAILGTAFSFVHLLDGLAEMGEHFRLPPGSRVLETGGYKGRSRNLPRTELHSLITERLGVPPSHIACEYGMSELSSQAYDRAARDEGRSARDEDGPRPLHFPPWARAQVISPETGCEVREGETGLIRVFDLANVYSVMAIQTEDLGGRRGAGFELIGRAALAEPRGCSLMTIEAQ